MPETPARPPSRPSVPASPAAREHCWLPCSERSPALARRLLREFLLKVRGGELFAENGALVVSELVTNALQHGTRRGQLIKLGLEADGELLCVWVEDASDQAPQLCVATEGERGRGLLLVDKLSQRWGWGARDGIGKRVWSVIEPAPAGVRP
ncbi:ATP-binding protein [Kitasatospora sp. NBC_01287]|uniref:ATP-binding protein n=1 Tax=Kitasatospora sp. NBC_01287 TaxID=2903573 RepID=UPI00224D0B82|nr:ATP-binding protein [Kitasatospora sp. NBC_01287]MCX4744984.1 ATP-binding protein [Kitasatospora sp. NBC_01287]